MDVALDAAVHTRRPNRVKFDRGSASTLMAAYPQIASMPGRWCSRQPWAKTGLPRCKKHRKTFACDKRSRRDEPGDEVCRGPASIHRRAQRRSLDDLDTGAPGIRDVGDLVAGRGRLAWRLVQLDAIGLELLHEGGVLLHVVDDEADVIDDRTHGAALALLLAEVEVDVDAREHHQGIATDVEHLGAHGEEELLVGIDVIGDDVPVPHGYAGRVERRRLRGRAARDKRRRKQ